MARWFTAQAGDQPAQLQARLPLALVSDAMAPRVKSVAVDLNTQASDHQPVFIGLA